jgi:hypothetical protein
MITFITILSIILTIILLAIMAAEVYDTFRKCDE